MDHRGTLIVSDHADLQRAGAERRSDEHRDRWIIGLERPPVVANRVHHVVVGNTVVASARLDVHLEIVPTEAAAVNLS